MVTVMTTTRWPDGIHSHSGYYDIDPDGTVTVYSKDELKAVAFYPDWLSVSGDTLEDVNPKNEIDVHICPNCGHMHTLTN